jgi:hypothetical protein
MKVGRRRKGEETKISYTHIITSCQVDEIEET